MRRQLFESTPITQGSKEITVLLQKGAILEGCLQFEGLGRIDGRFKGEIYTPDTLIIGEGAEVSGKIEAEVVVIMGHYEGEIFATHRVEIFPPAIVKGTIRTAVLQLEEGAIFEGKTKMLGSMTSH